MKNKALIAAILIVTLIALCGAMIAILVMSFPRLSTTGINLRVLQVDRYSAEGDQEWSFTADGPTTLLVDSRAGNVTITAGQGDEILVQAHKTAWHSSQARAEAALETMPIEVTQQGKQVTVRYKPPEKVLVVGETHMDTVDFTIQVPETATVNASTVSGDIALSGVTGDARLNSEFGDASASNLEGQLQIITNSGDIRAERVRAGEAEIDLHTQFGDIELEQATAGAVQARTNSGKISLADVEADQSVTLDTQFGDVKFENGRGADLTASSNSGKVTLGSLTLQGALSAKSEFGDIDVQLVEAASYDLDTNSGDILLRGAQASIKAATQFGRITIRAAKDANLDLRTNSGSIEFSGSLGEGPHTLKAEFGDVTMQLPLGVQLDFDLKSEFGRIKSDFPITIEGEVEARHWVGTINGGGASLKIEVNSGNISLEEVGQ
ncbi:MAG: DUF4097 family beta strand repeat-containing protein [Chloroflexota bacterium]